jgi:hypothetical protein
MDSQTKDFIKYVSILILVICVILWLYPQYKVYKERKSGEAELQRANYSRQIQIVESHAKLESASNLAAADTIRARGIAASNKIIGQTLENNPAYLQWLFIDQIKDSKNQIIYIPAGNLGFPLPIQEATRLQKPVILPPPTE